MPQAGTSGVSHAFQPGVFLEFNTGLGSPESLFPALIPLLLPVPCDSLGEFAMSARENISLHHSGQKMEKLSPKQAASANWSFSPTASIVQGNETRAVLRVPGAGSLSLGPEPESSRNLSATMENDAL